jgi:Spy/CpxP family protein refolding chaperone
MFLSGRPGVWRVCRGSIATTVVCLLALPAFAGQKSKWWHTDVYRRELGLTAEQVTRIDQIFHESKPALRAAKDELDRLEKELSQLIAEGTAEESKIVQKIERVEASRNQLGRTRSLMLYRMYRALDPDQRARLKALHDAKDRHGDRSQPSR